MYIRVGDDGFWTQLDQSSQYETDFWQTNYVREEVSYEFIYNVEIFDQETQFSFGPQPSGTITVILCNTLFAFTCKDTARMDFEMTTFKWKILSNISRMLTHKPELMEHYIYQTKSAYVLALKIW